MEHLVDEVQRELRVIMEEARTQMLEMAEECKEVRAHALTRARALLCALLRIHRSSKASCTSGPLPTASADELRAFALRAETPARRWSLGAEESCCGSSRPGRRTLP